MRTTLYGGKVYKTEVKERTFKTLEEYQGYAIQRVTTEKREYDHIMGGYIDMGRDNKFTTRIEICKVGDEGSISKCLQTYLQTVHQAETLIEGIIKGETYVLTYGDFTKYVTTPNHKCGWGFNASDLRKFLTKYKNGDARARCIIEERLTDANFHSYCSLLTEGSFSDYEKMIEEDYGKTA